MARMRVWLALFSPLVILGMLFSLCGIYFTAVKNLEERAVAAAIAEIAVVPTTLGFGLVLGLTWWMARREGLTLATLGWLRPTVMDVGVGLGVGGLLHGVNSHVFYPWVMAALPNFDPTLAGQPLGAVVLALTVAVVAEDTLFRGYTFEVLRVRYGILLATVVSTLGYAPLAGIQGWPLVVWATGFGVVLCGVKVWRRSLWPVSIIHVMVSLMPRLMS